MTRRLSRGCLAAAVLLCAPTGSPATSSTLVVTSLANGGPGSLRNAIEQANAAGGATITFQVAGTVEVQSSLPVLTAGATIIDACTAPGPVRLVAMKTSTQRFDGLRIQSPGNTVRCLTLRGFSRDGISVVGAQARDNRIEHNTVEDAGDDGIGVAYGASATVLENEVVGSVNKGVLVFNASSATVANNRLRGNKDGVSVTAGSAATIEGNTSEGNADNGVAVTSGSAATLRGNLVRANGGIGIWLKDPGTAVALLANTIDRNGAHGIGAKSGVSAEVTRNVISNNSGAGLWMESGAAVRLTNNTFADNAKGDTRVVP